MEGKALAAFWKENNQLYNETALLYHQLARAFGLSDCAFWLLYTLREEEAPLTQTQLSELLALPKQTVNSSLKRLAENGCVRLAAVGGNLKNKQVLLTEQGDALLRRSIDRVFQLEDQAAGKLTAEERADLLALERKLLNAFQAETDRFLARSGTPDTEEEL